MAKKYKRTTHPQQKANPIYAGMTMIDGMTQPRSMPRNYKSYAREGYGANDTLYKVINYAIINGAAIPPVLFKDKTMKSGKIEKHPLLDKLERPNPEWTGVFFRKAIIGYFLIAGNAFQYAIRTNKAGPPDELWTLPPDRVRPIPDQTRGIIGYQYEDWPAEKNPIAPELIGHLRTWNPEDPFFGMSPVQVAAIMIDQQTDARKWNLSLFQNFLKPPGAWTTTALLSPNERSKLEARINEKMAGFRNAGKAPVLDGALEFKPSAVAPSEMDWISSMKFNAGSIANVYNMPPQLIGDTSSTTFDNFEQAEIISYTEFIFPTLDDLYGLWNRWLVPMYPDLARSGAYLYYDKETVEVIQKVIQAQKTAQSDRGNKLWLSGLAMADEARELAGLPPLPGGAGKIFRIGAVLVPADKLMDYAEQSLAEPAAPPMPVPEPLLPLPAQPTDEEPQKPKPGAQPDEKKPPENGKNPPEDEKKPGDDEKKALPLRKWRQPTTDWIPDDLEKRLDAYRRDGVTHLTWRVDGSPCDACASNADVTVELGKLFPSGALLPEQHPNCFPAGTVVSGPPVIGSATRWYTGSLVEIETASGKFLSMTPNHPILTSKGWVAAGLLKEGDDVISCRRAKGPLSIVHPDDYQVPSLIENVANALGGSGEVSARIVPGSAIDFHGDGIEGEINVVRSYRALGDRFNPTISKPVLQKQFISGSSKLPYFPRLSYLDTLLDRAFHTTNCIVCSFRMCASILCTLGAGMQMVSSGYIPALNASQHQSFSDYLATDLKGVSKRLFRFARKIPLTDFIYRQRQVSPSAGSLQLQSVFATAQQSTLFQGASDPSIPDMITGGNDFNGYAGEIFVDCILKSHVKWFQGHVYNLQTTTGWYITNDIITHNCQCTVEAFSEYVLKRRKREEYKQFMDEVLV